VSKLSKTCLLFVLNGLDAQLTLVLDSLERCHRRQRADGPHSELRRLGLPRRQTRRRRFCCLRSLSMCAPATRQIRSKYRARHLHDTHDRPRRDGLRRPRLGRTHKRSRLSGNPSPHVSRAVRLDRLYSSSTRNETRLGSSALLQSAHNGAHAESILEPMLATSQNPES